MRAISATLATAQKGVSARPYVKAVLRDRWGGRARFRFTRHYTGVEADAASAACGAADGALVRAWIASGALFTKRVAAPGAGSDFASSPVSHGAVHVAGGVALAVAPDGRLRLLYVASGGINLTYKDSADGGVTWSSATTAVAAGGGKSFVAGAFSLLSGDFLAIWAEGATVYRSRWTLAGGWGVRTAWTNSVASITGLALAYGADFTLLVTGTEAVTLAPRCWSVGYGDGVFLSADTWTALAEVTGASAGSGVTFQAPALAYAGDYWLAFFVEVYAGTPAHTRLQSASMGGLEHGGSEMWREPWPWAYSGAGGVAIAYENLGGAVWLSASNGVWQGVTLPDLVLTGEVLEAAVEVSPADGAAELSLPAGRWGEALVARGAELELDAGLRTAAGDEVPTSGAPAYWVEAAELVLGADARVVLRCVDGWGVLHAWRARRTYAWAKGERSVFNLLRFVCARAGLALSGGTSDLLTGLAPAFVVHPGESGRTAVRRLLAMVPEVGRWQGGTLQLRNPSAGDAADYELGGSGHALRRLALRDVGPAWNRVRVQGLGVYAEDFDLADLEMTWERGRTVVDVNLTTGAEVEQRAAGELRDAAIGAGGDVAELFGVACGLELWDVVEVTEARAGLSGARRRLRSLSWRYSAGKQGVWEMRLQLGSV